MNPVKVRNIEIGAGMPKICVPVAEPNRKEILDAAEKLKYTKADIAEWRADWYEDIFDFEKTKETLAELRNSLGEMPLLFTFRTRKEGGERQIVKEEYMELNRRAVATGMIDLVDVELFTGDEEVRAIVGAAQANGVKVIVSSHDFQKTPSREEIISRLRKMQALGADIPKIAVMPENRKDVLTLLEATEEMTSLYADRPIITMSMSGLGSISRLCGEVFGSALTFGTVGRASAPGQLKAQDLAAGLELIHKSL